MALGLPLRYVVAMVTRNTARMVGLEGELDTLNIGSTADFSVLDDHAGQWVPRDNEGTEVVAERLLMPAFCLRAGDRLNATASILPKPQPVMGPERGAILSPV